MSCRLTYLVLHLLCNVLLLNIDSVALVQLCTLLALELLNTLSQDLGITLLKLFDLLHDLLFEIEIAALHVLGQVIHIGLHHFHGVQDSSMGCVVLSYLLMKSGQW